MSFSPFDRSDFDLMKTLSHKTVPQALESKTEALRKALAEFPEFELDFFKNRLARRARMRSPEQTG